ncbi:SDR family oxidoreductase [Micropruina sp.]|uniref:SDR family oxidoreductase n=1 Tax=Micropruina sp. TaxID=2737536 RepID=UPI00261E6AE6|nr:SDR family oxidoreductase [Micropruina sp.]
MDLGLTDRVFLVTAASAGLGRASAEQLVAEGARVVLVARRADVLDDVVADLGSANAVALAADLAEPDTAAAAAQLAIRTFGRLDGALISVGGPPPGSVLANSDEQWLATFESVFLAALRAVRAVLAAASGPASIGVVLSTSVKVPIPGLAISNGLRPGLAMLIKQLADEVGPDGHRVFGLMPGTVLTERIRFLHGRSDDPTAARKDAEARIPLRRLGDPAEFGRVAAFLLSPAASYVTGSVIPVDGGALRAL